MAQHNEFGEWNQIYRRLRNSEGLPFSDLLKPEQVARALAALEVEYRERVYTPVATLWMFLWQVLSADHSCRDTVGRLLAWRLSQGMSPCSTDTASYCEARQRLPLKLIQQLTTAVARELEPRAEPEWLWKGRHVKIVDGSTVTMPDTPENQAAYPRRRNQPHGVGFPIARVVAIFSLTCQGYSVFHDAEEFQHFHWSGSEAAKGGDNPLGSGQAQEGQPDVAASSQILRAVTDVGSAMIFAKHGIADPVQAVLKAPVAAPVRQDFGSGSLSRRESGDCKDDLHRGFPLAGRRAFQAADLLEAVPFQLPRQPRTDLQMPLCQATVAFFAGSRLGELGLPLAFAMGGKIQPGTRPRSRP